MANTVIKIPYQQSKDTSFNLFQTNLAQALSPVTSQPMAKSKIIPNIKLKAGINTIQTGLGYPLTGWYLIRQKQQAQIWDDQDSNKDPNNSLILYASAAVEISLVIF